ncbi:MAG: N-acetylmuramoyl-L-alanine amidase [Paracoccaceae bacterium]
MSRLLGIFLVVMLAFPAAAQDFGARARVLPTESFAATAEDDRGVELSLGLSQGVPFRIFTLAEPTRLVLDFQEVDWSGLTAAQMETPERVTQTQFGTYVPGWSRMVLELSEPMEVKTAALTIDPVTSQASLAIQLRPVSAEDFAALVGAPYDARWDLPEPESFENAVHDDLDAPMHVVLDAGHGGIDPGAEVGEVIEKDLMLTFARELRDVLIRSGGFKVTLLRDDDAFVSLERRVALAHRAGADAFISLHADVLSEGLAHGATVYVLSEEASDLASAKLAERHDRGDLLAGADLSEADDRVTDILLDLARQETRPRTLRLAQELVSAMTQVGGPMNRRPLRKAGFSVLKSADIPSVLVELGFMSSPRDLVNLTNPEWRMGMAEAIRNGLANWREAEAATRPLVRQ